MTDLSAGETPERPTVARVDDRERTITFTEYGTHKVIGNARPGVLRVADQLTIDALREAFEKAGYKVIDHGG